MRSAADALEKLGVLCIVASSGVHGLAVLAAQAPSSPWRVPLFQGPLDSTAMTLLFTGVIAVFAARIARDAASWRVFGCTAAGTALTLVTGAIGATTGMIGAQLLDPRPGALALLLARGAGSALLMAALLLWALARRRSGSDS